MLRISIMLFVSIVGLAACTPAEPTLGPDGKPLPRLYRISDRQAPQIQFRMLDSINALRGAAGSGVLEMDAQLNAAAATHSRDMSIQNRPWHFGSDGSSPMERVVRVGYPGQFLGENISETYETELETLSAWMEQEDTRRVILNPAATKMGFSWFQEQNGKIWWTLVTGN
ncbi:CAP domain-containing protein [Thalassovita sp.]|jgi:uncharacterized protein YkwD|uniref:CAP domain-containing protein n=1 Tax=Thalassovita sp. TaxID=1979401 RepID=UPI003B5A5D7C